MIVETPATGEARIVDGDSSEPLAITLEFLGRVHYMLAPMLETGWRIVDATPAELAPLQAPRAGHCAQASVMALDRCTS